jgi:hypothetical protein
MNSTSTSLLVLLHTAAALQAGVAVLNLFLVRLLGWKADLARLPLLAREVFQVHLWFISITLGNFAVVTWRFAGDFAQGTHPLCHWLAAGIGIFWGIRWVMQFAYYSGSHWRGHGARTVAHLGLLAVYGGFAAVYLWAAWRGTGGSL